jgi:RsmE family RNA methyltransferase
VGDRIRVGIVDGPLGHAEVVAMNEREIRLRAVFEAETPPRPCVSLLLAMPRPKALKRLWAPLAAAGVDAIFVLPAERVERMYFDSDALHPALIRSRLIEGLAQAADTRLPRVEIRRRLRPFLEDEGEPLWRDARRLLAHPGNAPRVADRVRPGERVWLAVGAEGGWTPYERELWRAHGFEEVSMGPRAWRSGPACLALIALAQDARRREMGMPVVEKEAE